MFGRKSGCGPLLLLALSLGFGLAAATYLVYRVLIIARP
jgi:hypothetical protein